MFQIAVLSLLFSAAPAGAAEFTCAGFGTFAEEIVNCDDNTVLGRAALNCSKMYRAHIKATQDDVIARFQAQIAKMREAQNDNFDKTQAGYEDARRRLDALIEEGKAARARVDDLYANMMFPEDAEDPSITGMSTQDYLASEECYAVPQRVMLQSQAMIDKMMNDVAVVRDSVVGKGNTSGNRSANVQVLEQNRGAAHTTAAGSGNAPKGNSRNPASDITGTEQQKKKDAAGQRVIEK